MTICMTPSNPYNGALYEKSRALSDCVLERLGAALDKPQNERTLWQTDTMTGINYSEVPVTIVEMGFMTNPPRTRQWRRMRTGKDRSRDRRWR